MFSKATTLFSNSTRFLFLSSKLQSSFVRVLSCYYVLEVDPHSRVPVVLNMSDIINSGFNARDLFREYLSNPPSHSSDENSSSSASSSAPKRSETDVKKEGCSSVKTNIQTTPDDTPSIPADNSAPIVGPGSMNDPVLVNDDDTDDAGDSTLDSSIEEIDQDSQSPSVPLSSVKLSSDVPPTIDVKKPPVVSRVPALDSIRELADVPSDAEDSSDVRDPTSKQNCPIETDQNSSEAIENSLSKTGDPKPFVADDNVKSPASSSESASAAKDDLNVEDDSDDKDGLNVEDGPDDKDNLNDDDGPDDKDDLNVDDDLDDKNDLNERASKKALIPDSPASPDPQEEDESLYEPMQVEVVNLSSSSSVDAEVKIQDSPSPIHLQFLQIKTAVKTSVPKIPQAIVPVKRKSSRRLVFVDKWSVAKDRSSTTKAIKYKPVDKPVDKAVDKAPAEKPLDVEKPATSAESNNLATEIEQMSINDDKAPASTDDPQDEVLESLSASVVDKLTEKVIDNYISSAVSVSASSLIKNFLERAVNDTTSMIIQEVIDEGVVEVSKEFDVPNESNTPSTNDNCADPPSTLPTPDENDTTADLGILESTWNNR